jgi:hypothetical protein
VSRRFNNVISAWCDEKKPRRHLHELTIGQVSTLLTQHKARAKCNFPLIYRSHAVSKRTGNWTRRRRMSGGTGAMSPQRRAVAGSLR